MSTTKTQDERLKELRELARIAGLTSDGWHRDGGLAVWIDGAWRNWIPEYEESNKPYKRFGVLVAQVNSTYIEVEARDGNEAREIGKSKWRSEYAIPQITSIELINEQKYHFSPK